MSEDWKRPTEYDSVHAERFRLSREWLAPLLKEGTRVLALGDPGSFERGIAQKTGQLEVYTADLRYATASEPRDFDLVLCTEVLEHIHDQEDHKPTEWRATGTRHLLSTIYSLLRPGGALFLTTPNACSYNVLAKVLTMQPPMVYRPHVREYAPAEVDTMLREAGFRIERFATVDPWGGGVNAATRLLLDKLTRDHAHHSPHRGEDIFVIARKPNNNPPPQPRPVSVI